MALFVYVRGVRYSSISIDTVRAFAAIHANPWLDHMYTVVAAMMMPTSRHILLRTHGPTSAVLRVNACFTDELLLIQ